MKDFIKDLFEDMPVVASIVALITATGVFFIFDACLSTKSEHRITVIDKYYKAEHNSTGTGVGMVGGNTAVVVTSSHEDEEFILMVRFTNGIVVSAKSSPTVFYSKEKGSKGTCKIVSGRWTNIAYGIYVTN